MTPLRLRMLEDMQIRNLAALTQKSYIEQVARFARHFDRSPEHLGPDEIRSWLLYLAQDKHLAASSMCVAVAALRFCYTVTLARACPHCRTGVMVVIGCIARPGVCEPVPDTS
jgi:integrase/recombinase XerD